MDHVSNQRAYLLAVLLALAFTTHGLVFEYILPQLKQLGPAAELAKSIVTAGAIYSSLVLFPIWVYDRGLWKRLNPKYDISGIWSVSITRIHKLKPGHITKAGQAETKRFIDKVISTGVSTVIEQTPFRARVISGVGYSSTSAERQAIIWSAEIMTNELPGSVAVVFQAVVDGSVSGRDHVMVKEWDKRGRPSLMIGEAFHVITDFDIVVRGDIEYRRIDA